MIASQNLDINATLEFLETFKSSQSISTTKGKSHFLARIPKITKDQHKFMVLEEENKELDSKTALLRSELNELKS